MKKVFFILAIVTGVIIINNLARSVYDIWKKKDLVISAQEELEAQKRENERLKTQLKQAQDPKFIEEEARNKLLLVKPGEEHVIIPQDLATSEASLIKKDTRPNWKKWWEYFF